MASLHKPLICLATDHAGFALKEAIRRYLAKVGYTVKDFGAFDDISSDYPDFVLPAARTIAEAKNSAYGIVFGGSGIGECIAANKIVGVRAALAYDAYTAKVTRQHNDANILCLGARTITGSPTLAKKLVKIFLSTPFSGDIRHRRRLQKISRAEKGLA